MAQDMRRSARSSIPVLASGRRAIPRTKAEIAAAVRNGDLSVEEACKYYGLTLADCVAYLEALGANGVAQAPNDHYRDGRSAAYGRSAMSPEEALKLFALQEGASETQIRSAYRRLIMRNHPDRGGSDYFAAKINEAKDVLLGL